MAQDRKVFVGGVPQDLKQEDLYAIFSEFSNVKKAWLQKCRTSDEGGMSTPQQNHRGFGFVIFHDASAIEELLGSSASRFVLLRNGAKLEVKRALSSNKMTQVQGLQESLQNAGAASQETSAPLTLPSTVARGARPPGRVQPQPSRAGDQGGGSQAAAAAPQRPKPVPSGTGGSRNQLQGLPAPLAALYAGSATGMPSPHGGPRADPVLEEALFMAANPSLPRRLPVPTLFGPPMTASQMSDGQGAAPHGNSAVRKALREAIVRFYNEHRPEKLAERDFLDFICSIYEGREAELDQALRQKYGEGLQLSPQTQPPAALSPPFGGFGRTFLPATSPGASPDGLLGGAEPMYAWPAESLLSGRLRDVPAVGPIARPTVGPDGAGEQRGMGQADVGPSLIPVAAAAGLPGHSGTLLDEAARAINSRATTLHEKDWLHHAVW